MKQTEQQLLDCLDKELWTAACKLRMNVKVVGGTKLKVKNGKTTTRRFRGSRRREIEIRNNLAGLGYE